MEQQRLGPGARIGGGNTARWILVGLLAAAAAVGGGCAVGVAMSRSISSFPLRVKARTLKRSGERLRGSMVVINVGDSSVTRSEAALVLRPTHQRVLEGVGEVTVPGLKAKSRRTVVISGRIPSHTPGGRYQVLGCVDVGSQVARFDAHRNCVTVGSLRISAGDAVKSTSPRPRTRLTGRPAPVSRSRTASFRFSSSTRASRFQCRLDGGPWFFCTSPKAYARLVLGKHEFEVRAVTRAGRADQSPARAAWQIRPPATTTPTTSTSTTTAAPASPRPATSITVDTTHPGSPIDPALFGSDYLAPFGGMGSFDAGSGQFWPSFTAQLTSEVGAGSLRFPGGITGQSYQWMRAIGAQGQRQANPVGPNGRPSPSSVGPDEFGQLLDRTGAQGVFDVDFANGTAQEAADLVQYMTGTDTSNQYVAQRVQDGHPAPYDVPYWEIGNEEETPQFWRAGSNPTVEPTSVPGVTCPGDPTGLYICGGTTSFTGQAVVGNGNGDRSPSSSTSDGQPGQTFQVAYPPVAVGSAFSLQINGATWNDYTLNRSTGTITFGAMTPPTGTVTATYQSGPHDGFEQYYAAMKAANPAIQVCATDTGTSFIADAGTSLPYDCLQDHPYVGTGAISAALPIDLYEADVMAVADGQYANVQSFQAQTDQAAGRHVPLVLTEYGQLINSTPDPLQAPYYLNSLDEALVNASQLADWIKLGVPVADRQLLAAELPVPSAVTASLPGAAPFATTGAITTSGGPQTIVQPTGEYQALMRPLAGGSLLNATVGANPAILGSSPSTGDLAVVAAAAPSGVQLVVINRSPTVDVASAVNVAGVTSSATATVTTLDGPSPLSDNSGQAPNAVSTSTSAVTFAGGGATITFPAHSVSLVTLPGF